MTRLTERPGEYVKAITLHQPWASLVAHGEKRIETRSWSTSHRGTLVIHAALSMPLNARMICKTEPFLSALGRWGYEPAPGGMPLPRGMVLAVATLADVVPAESVKFAKGAAGLREAMFGDYTPGRFAWILTDVERLETPVPWQGRQRIWNVPATVLV